MKLTRTRTSYDLLTQELGASKRDPFVESCLAQYLAVTFYSEMEERVAEIITSHLKKFTDSRIGQYLAANMDGMIRRTPKSNMAKFVGSLDESFRTKFDSQINERQISIYTNIIQARHSIGHKQGSPIDLSEIPVAIDAADAILVALDSCFAE
jgi:hypothetical protein